MMAAMIESMTRWPVAPRLSSPTRFTTYTRLAALCSLLLGLLVFSSSRHWRSSRGGDKIAAGNVFSMLPESWPQRNRTDLSRQILKTILKQTTTVHFSESASVSYIPPCGAAANVVESTSSLLVANAMAKADNTTTPTSSAQQRLDMWQFFNALFAVPSTTGFIPKYHYPVVEKGGAKDDEPSLYIPNTRIPNWPMFQLDGSEENIPSPCPSNKTQCWIGSGRISAMPFHGTFLLELVLQMEQREELEEAEMAKLEHYWHQLFAYHSFLHNVVMRGCGGSYNNNNNLTTAASGVPCYNILHPWESMLDATSPVWHQALRPAMESIQASNWSLPFPVPKQVVESYDYNETSYAVAIFLVECLANYTTRDGGYPYEEFQGEATQREDQILQACPFAMLDVGYAAALAQADEDLYRVGLLLSAQRSLSSSMGSLKRGSSQSWNSKFAVFHQWRVQNKHVLHLTWNQEEHSYLSRYAVPSTIHPFPSMRWSKTGVVNNLMVFWKEWADPEAAYPNRGEDDSRLQDMALQLLHHRGDYSFDCKNYPLWSAGCDNLASIVDPSLDYFVGLGLSRNQGSVAAFGTYLTNATIDLICDPQQTGEPTCARNTTIFQEAYAVQANSTFSMDECGSTSTATAAILYHLLLDDFDFSSETPAPPIGNSWVITLITAELMIAFAVGVSCVALSLSIVRRENIQTSIGEEPDGSGSYMGIQSLGSEGFFHEETDMEEDIE